MHRDASSALQPYLPAISMMLRRLADDRSVERLWRRDASLWHPSADTQARIRERLGWLDLPLPPDPAVNAWLAELQRDEYEQLLYVASGPSASIARLWQRETQSEARRPHLALLDTVAPVQVEETLAQVDRQRAAVLFAGNDLSPELVALCRLVLECIEKSASLRAHRLAMVTTPTSPFDVWMTGVRDLRRFALPTGVPERFGAFSLLGALPASLWGYDLAQIHSGASRMRSACRTAGRLQLNPGVWLGTILGVLAQHGRDKLTLLAQPPLAPVAEWIATLVAGSLCKHRRGFVPIFAEALKATPHSHDQIFVQFTVSEPDDPELATLTNQLEAMGQPLLRFTIPDAAALGSIVAQWEVAVAVAGMIIGVNPFDEPDTVAFRQALERQLLRSPVPPPQGLSPQDPALARALQLLFTAEPKPSYVALVPYFSPTMQQGVALSSLRTALARHGYSAIVVQPLRDPLAATQLLHAGRPDGAMIAVSTQQTLAASGQFGKSLQDLCNARLQTDLSAWSRAGRSCLHLDLGDDVLEGLAACSSALRAMF